MRKRLGQHFLRNRGILAKIAGVLDIEKDDLVIEIGPGHGELTAEIIKFNPKKLIIIEKDRILWPLLEERFKEFIENGQIKLIKGDALEELAILLKKGDKNQKVIGNIPYYISGKLFRVLSETKNPPEKAVFLIQKEVAERIFGKIGNNALSACADIWAESKIRFCVPKKDFSPPPKVESAVIELSRKNQQFSVAQKERYFKAIRAMFQQPRKTCFNNLRQVLKNESVEKIKNLILELGQKESSRSEEFTFEQIKKISEKLF